MADSPPPPAGQSSIGRILGSRKGAYVAAIVVLALPILCVLTFLAGTGKMPWAIWTERVQWIFALVAGLAATAVVGTAVEDAASKGAASSVQVQGDNATVNVPSVRPPPSPDVPKVSISPTAPWNESATIDPLKKEG